MVEIWFAILAFMLTTFVVLDGWDIGAGAVHLIVAKTDSERRQVVGAIGPLWSWHEVWLISAGGVLFVAFPTVLASALSGFYLAVFLLLWSLVLRGVSIEVGGHIHDPLWQTAWDVTFAVSNILLAILFGAALGNIVRGVPIDASGRFSLSFFTNFGVRGNVGILDWYTVFVGVFALVMLMAHGATYLTLKTEGPVHDRSESLSWWLWAAVFALLPLLTLATWCVCPELPGALMRRPIAWIAVAVVISGAVAVITGLRGRRELRAFIGSCAIIVGLLGGAAASIFPVILRSTISPEFSMTAYSGSAERLGLGVALVWWPVSLMFAVGYFYFIFRNYAGKVRPAEDTQGYY